MVVVVVVVVVSWSAWFSRSGALARAFGDLQAAGRHGIAGAGQSWSWAM
jgi:hypothetical protein